MAHCTDLGRYLGVPLHTNRAKRSTYSQLLDKIRKRLSSWKATQLSLAGRTTLVQSVTSSIAVYTMQTAKLPVSVTKEIDKLNRDFLWGSTVEKRKVHLVKWDNVCRDKDKGGLGIRKSANMNTALLAKLGWKLEEGDEGLWARVLRAKYLKQETFSQARISQNSSHTWRSIVSAKSLVQQGCARIVGDGSTTLFWKDKWLGDKSLLERGNVLPLSEEEQTKQVKDYACNGSWSEQLLEILPTDIREQLMLVQLRDDESDRIYWHASTDGNFSVSSAYKLLTADTHSDGIWKKLWKLDVPPRVKFFLWLLFHNRLLTRVACVHRNILSSAACPRCGVSEETTLHALRDCSFSQAIWSAYLHGAKLFEFNADNLEVWLRKNVSKHHFLVNDMIPWSIFFYFAYWHIWRWRNRVVFEKDFSWPDDALFPIAASIDEFRTHMAQLRIPQRKVDVFISWTPPPTGFVKLNVDAAARTNPGDLAAGGLFRSADGDWLFGFTCRAGFGHITKAELVAILHGLTLAWESGFSKIIVESDSLLAVNKILQEVGSRDPLFQIIKQCQDLVSRNWDCVVQHTYREANMCADFLASWAFQGVAGVTVLTNPPGTLHRLIEEDLLRVARPRAIVS